MKKIPFLLFVIGIMITAPFFSVAQNNIEERQKILEIIGKEHSIRFTLEIERDSALCLPQSKSGECYIQSQTFKKYVYVDISQTPYITTSYARECFNSSNIWISTTKAVNSRDKIHSTSPPTRDFESIRPVYKYSGFPWLQMTTTEVDNRYYMYNTKHFPVQMEKKTDMRTYTEFSIHILVLWIIMLSIIITGVWSVFLGKFVSLFENAGWLLIVTTVILVIIVYAYDQEVWSPIIIYATAPIFFRKDRDDEDIIFSTDKGMEVISYQSLFNFLYSLGSVSMLLFWSVNKIEIYYILLVSILCIVMISFFIITIYENRKKLRIKERFSFLFRSKK